MVVTLDELYQTIQTTDVTLTFDTNVLFKKKRFLELCISVEKINSYREKGDLPYRISLCVSAVAHTEHLFHEAQLYPNFDITIVQDFLEERNIKILDFTIDDAEHCAKLLHQRYDTPSKWRAFKKRRCLECAGLPLADYNRADGSGRKCGASNDWLIIAQASGREALLVTEDKGEEFDTLKNIVRFEKVETALNQVVTELTRLWN